MKIDTLFLSGPQGSGKGTQARILADKRGYFHWEMGALLRAEAKTETEVGKKIAVLINAGSLVSDVIIKQVLDVKFKTIPKDQTIMFDGFPRNMEQADFLLAFLHEHGRKDFVTMLLDIPKDESLKRLLLRAQVEHRLDDTPETIEKRLYIYEMETLPMLNTLRDKTYFIDIDGRSSIEEVSRLIENALTQLDD